MNAAEWSVTTDWHAMLWHFVSGIAGASGERSATLAGCALCRRLGPVLDQTLPLGLKGEYIIFLPAVVEFLERYADGGEREEDLKLLRSSLDGFGTPSTTSSIYNMLAATGNGGALESFVIAADHQLLSKSDLSNLVREVFGNPFVDHRTLLPPKALDSAIRRLAGEMYESRSFERMPELGRLLETAGVGVDRSVVDHCRSQATHYRGCWVVDAVLGKRSEPPKPSRLEQLGVFRRRPDAWGKPG